MINLMTIRRKIATVLTLPTLPLILVFGIPDTAFSQNVNQELTDTPLTLDEPVVSVLQSSIEPAAEKPPAPQLNDPELIEKDALETAMQEDLEVLTRGPLHEAFATVHQSNPAPSVLIEKAPPETIEEVPPEYKPEGKNVQWIPGYWSWDDAQSDFIWISGVWRDLPPGRRWVPGYWDQSDEGNRWVSGIWAEEERQELGYLPEPPADIDQGPSTQSPGDDYFYVPGNWDYYGGRYRWLSGHWQPVVSNWIWIPARYIWTPRGCIYQSGYWDYEVEYRGTCFAPVYFRNPVYRSAHYHYTPTFAVTLNIDFLTHLFVRPGCGHYFYGDWYNTRFVGFGYKPWVHHHSHHRHYDPLLAYYNCQRSSYDPRFNVVQYLAQQHAFYNQHHEYRPRPTFSAHFNFVNKSNRGDRHHDFVRKSNYVKQYANLVHQNGNHARNQHNELEFKNRKLASELNKQQAKFRRVEQQERLQNKKKLESMARLQKQRQRAEVKLASQRVDLRSKSSNRRPEKSLKLPKLEASARQIRELQHREFARGKKGSISKTSDFQSKELKRAVENARKSAAVQNRMKLERERKAKAQLANQQRNQRTAGKQQQNRIVADPRAAKLRAEKQQQARNQLLKNRADQQKRLNHQQDNIARNNRQDQSAKREQRKPQNSIRDAQRRAEQQRLQQAQNKQKQNQTNSQNQRSTRVRNQVNEAQRKQEQQRRAQNAAKQAQQQQRQNQARQAQQKQEQQRRLQDAARQAQQRQQQNQAKEAQRKQDQQRRTQDAAKRARDLQRQNQARQAQNRARKEAAQRASKQRQQANRQKQQQRNNKAGKKK